MRERNRHLKLPATLLLGVLATGCSTVANLPDSWRVEPLFRLSHAGGDAGRGLVALGRAYEGERRWRDASDAYRRAAAQAPDDPEIYNALGRALAAQHRHAEAVAAFRRAVDLQPMRAQWFNNLGYALMLQGQHEEAHRVLRQALALAPGHALASANLAAVERKLGPRAPSAPRPAEAPPALATREAEAPSSPALRVHVEPTLPPLQVRTGETIAQAQPQETTPSVATPSPVEPGPAPAGKAHARLEIANGNGITGAAARLAEQLQRQGYSPGRLSNLRPFTTARTVVQFREGHEMQAQEIARGLPVTPVIARASALRPNVDVRVILGHDAVEHDRAYLARKPGTSPAGTL